MVVSSWKLDQWEIQRDKCNSINSEEDDRMEVEPEDHPLLHILVGENRCIRASTAITSELPEQWQVLLCGRIYRHLGALGLRLLDKPNMSMKLVIRALITNESMRLIISTVIGVMLGLFIGMSSPTVIITNLQFSSSFLSYIEDKDSGITTHGLLNHAGTSVTKTNLPLNSNGPAKIYVPSNPKGAERLPPGILARESDFYLRRLWGSPSEDLRIQQKYLVAFAAGLGQKENIDAAVKKFSENFTIVLFHYDGRTSEWDEFEWSKRAIHVSAKKQTKWWFAKRFLHPDIVACYEYIFIWDEDLGVEHFNAEEYIKLVRKYGLEISQPGLDPNSGFAWQMTRRMSDREVHKETEERPGWCTDPHLPPCAAFVEIMAPVFSRNAWRCAWHMIQNDLVHGWGLDLALRKCVEPAHEKIGVVDSQWIVHQVVPSLGNQGKAENGNAPWVGVRERCRNEWGIFQTRLADAEKSYYIKMGITPPNDTHA